MNEDFIKFIKKKFNQVEKGHKILSKYLVGEVDGREDGEVKV